MSVINLDVEVYLTTKDSGLFDLKSCKQDTDFYEWEHKVESHAFRKESFNEVTDEILREARRHSILEAYALIEYPQGALLQADGEIGGRLRELFKRNRIKFSCALVRDDRAHRNYYKVSLEIVVEKKNLT